MIPVRWGLEALIHVVLGVEEVVNSRSPRCRRMCAGHERFHGVAAEHLRSAHGVLAVYDVADAASLAALLDTFLPQLSRYHPTRLQHRRD